MASKDEKPKRKGPAPKHQNSFAFRHNKNSTLTAKILEIPNCGLCRQCHEMIEWKKKYRKYKPRSCPGKCSSCDNKNVQFAYHVLCIGCATKKKVCAKCMLPKEIQVDPQTVIESQVTDIEAIDKLQASGLKLRQKRSIMRDFERGDITAYEIVAALDGKLAAREEDSESDEDVSNLVSDSTTHSKPATSINSDVENNNEDLSDDLNDDIEEDLEDDEIYSEEDDDSNDINTKSANK